MTAPLISVIMPVYNAAPFVREAIESVLTQTLGDFELIAIDDASTDHSREVLAGVTDRRCRVLGNATNLGAAETKNRGIKEARGEFLAFLDADDVAVPERFARQVEWLRAHPNVGVLGSNVEHIDPTGRSLGSHELAELDPHALRARLLFQNRIAQSSVLARVSALRGIGFRREFEPAEDYDVWVRLECSLAVIGETLVQYRVHPQSVSATKGAAMSRAVAAIHAAQLAQFGLQDSAHLHGAVVAFDAIASFDLFTRIERWLCTLREANYEHARHEQETFDRVLNACWFQAGDRAFQLGIPGWKFWRRSKINEAPLRDDLYLFLRALRQDLGRIIRRR